MIIKLTYIFLIILNILSFCLLKNDYEKNTILNDNKIIKIYYYIGVRG